MEVGSALSSRKYVVFLGEKYYKKVFRKKIKKNSKIVLTYLKTSDIVYLVVGQESSADKKKHLRGVAQLG